MSDAARPIPPRALATVPGFLALGGGVGLAPRAPGTVGTLVGIPVVLVMPSPLFAYGVVLIVLIALGVWVCGRCASDLGVHDHPGIVWDEIVGYAVTMIAVPPGGLSLLLGFALFRLFDILKPWPIGFIDRRVHGGLGIMLDDILAGVLACVCLHGLMRLLA